MRAKLWRPPERPLEGPRRAVQGANKEIMAFAANTPPGGVEKGGTARANYPRG